MKGDQPGYLTVAIFESFSWHNYDYKPYDTRPSYHMDIPGGAGGPWFHFETPKHQFMMDAAGLTASDPPEALIGYPAFVTAYSGWSNFEYVLTKDAPLNMMEREAIIQQFAGIAQGQEDRRTEKWWSAYTAEYPEGVPCDATDLVVALERAVGRPQARAIQAEGIALWASETEKGNVVTPVYMRGGLGERQYLLTKLFERRVA